MLFNKPVERIIFLDIDGVLNSIGHSVAYTGQPEPAYRACTIDKIGLGLLRYTCEVTQSHIVISSTWRSHGADWMKGVFEAHGWVYPPIIGVTDREGGFRGDQVDRYLESNHPDIEYVCIDDDSDFHEHHRLIKTDPLTGFTLYDAIKIIDFFGVHADVEEEHGDRVKALKGHVDFQLNKKERVSSKFKE